MNTLPLLCGGEHKEQTLQLIGEGIDDFNHLMDAMRYAPEDFSRRDAYNFD